MTSDRVFDEPRLADLYDALDPDRTDLDAYLAIVRSLGARSVLDVGCGTGTFALLLSADGVSVCGVDPAAAMLAVARRKDASSSVRWVHGVVADVPISTPPFDVATMTANVAQVFLEDDEWHSTLAAIRDRLRDGGTLVFESRRPEREAWLDWVRDSSFSRTDVDGVGVIESWYDLLEVSLPLVTFRGTLVLPSGDVLESDSTLRFRPLDELVGSVEGAGFRVEDVRDAPDRPGKEHVIIAVRAGVPRGD